MSSPAHQTGVFHTDHRPEEVLAASFIAASVPVWIVIIWSISKLGMVAAGVPEVEQGLATPIRVTPMIDMDSPLLKGGGKKAKFPDAWAAPPAPRQETAVVSPNAKDDPDAIPKPMPIYDGGSPPDPDAATTTNPDADVNPPAGEGGGKPGTDPPGGDGDGGGTPGSKDGNTTDRAKVRAAQLYNGRLASFFRAGFRCPQLPEGAPKCSPTGSVTISGDLTVTSVSFSGCGVQEIDSAAQSALNSKKGQQVPPPPAEYPELQPPSFGVTYVCK